MTCKDCLHYEVCRTVLEIVKIDINKRGADADKRCGLFQNKTEYVKRERGEWVHSDLAASWHGKDECGRCGYHTADRVDLSVFNFCPNCGADMR